MAVSIPHSLSPFTQPSYVTGLSPPSPLALLALVFAREHTCVCVCVYACVELMSLDVLEKRLLYYVYLFDMPSHLLTSRCDGQQQ